MSLSKRHDRWITSESYLVTDIIVIVAIPKIATCQVEPGPSLTIPRSDSAAILSDNGSAAFKESCAHIGWNSCDASCRNSKTGPKAAERTLATNSEPRDLKWLYTLLVRNIHTPGALLVNIILINRTFVFVHGQLHTMLAYWLVVSRAVSGGCLLLTGFISNHGMDMTSIMKCGMKLLIYFLTSTVQSLTFENGKVSSYHT